VLRQIRKTTKKPPLYVAQKYVETYFSSNAAAQDPEERVFYNCVLKNRNIILRHKVGKQRLTDLE